MDTKMYGSFVAALATVVAAGLIVWLIMPFARPIAWAMIIGVATIPYYRKMAARMPGHPGLSAAVMVLCITLCLVLPVTGLLFVIVQNAGDWLKEAEQLVASLAAVQKSPLSEIPFIGRIVSLVQRIGIDMPGHVGRLISGASQHVVNAATAAAKNMAQVALTSLLTIFILFFVYRDGDRIVSQGALLIPADREKIGHYLHEIQSTTTAVVIGTLFTAFMQGVLAGVAYHVAGLPVPILLGLLTAVGGLLPVVGTTIVWLPVVIFVAFGGELLKAGLLALWCLLVVIAFADMVIRPLSAAAQSDVPTLPVVIGALGGAMTCGLIGLILGPIVLGIVVMIWKDVTGVKPL